ncbi:hypothetical protein AXG93_4031s1220 [Marchantia polymorpha subsp. ruderalis]|uniref:Uncharacterized protein n=1 Tax=Marchantia polymorpha subsp. ruderalis TaxID=1480154 RepID=A0A176WEQ0_MARPO|nr:hypothetical protein AXG93_4031s1220 [Marchantia polymorpha subsp. ruderalis]
MGEAWQRLYKNKWLVLAFSIWIQSCSGVGYAFGSYSPIIKSVLGFDQKGISRLGVAKDIGDSVGLLAGTLCDLVPIWGLFICGALVNLIGYGSIWLIVTKQLPPVPLWAMCLIMMVATNGETFFNTGALVACVRNFPQNRGGIVGILKGFTGLSGAIFTQLYTSFYAPDQAKFIFLVATGPSMVALFTLLIVRPIPQVVSIIKEDDKNFNVIYSVCLVIAAYLMGAMIVHDFLSVNHYVQVGFAFGLLLLLFIPLIVPFYQVFVVDPKKPQSDIENDYNIKAPLLAPAPPERTPSGREIKNEYPKAIKPTITYYPPPSGDFIEFSEMEDEKMRPEVSERARHEQLARMSSRLYKAVAEGAVKVKRKRGPRRGQDFTLAQALIKADFWLIDYAAPRPILMACAQGMMAVGHLMFAMAWPGSMYIASLLVGFGYGCHWAIVPATASELFGLKNFGALYNVLTIAVPIGSLVFSGLIAGPIYDAEAEKQRSGALGAYARGPLADESLVCEGAICFQLTFFIMTAVCIFGVVLNLILIKRTYRVYQALYGKRGDSLLHNKVPRAVLEQDASSSSSFH